MYCWEDENYIVIPLAFNIFFRESVKYKRHINFAKEYPISDGLLEELEYLIREMGESKTVAVDFERVIYPARMLEGLRGLKQKAVFYNVHGEVLRQKMRENLPDLDWSPDEDICLLNGNVSEAIMTAHKEVFSSLNKKLYIQILQDIKDPCEKDRPLWLDSSGLYGNMYINVKKLFLSPESYYFVLYGMALEVEKWEEFDSFISSSKNGAILAALLGAMLNKKVVHIHGIGPKYAMRIGNIQNEIKRGKKYVYVYDYICTGTELKILSALVNANDARLAGGIGLARYGSAERENQPVPEKIKCLITTDDAGLDYKVAGTEGDMLKLMGS